MDESREHFLACAGFADDEHSAFACGHAPCEIGETSRAGRARHELDIASYTKRNLVMRDGQLISDTLVANRLSAAEELRKLDEAQQAAQLHP